MKIIKRDGREVPYDYEKIKRAIEAANGEVAQEDRLSDTMVGFIVGRIEKRIEAAGRSVTVEKSRTWWSMSWIRPRHTGLPGTTATTGSGMSFCGSVTARMPKSSRSSATTMSWRNRRTQTRTRC